MKCRNDTLDPLDPSQFRESIVSRPVNVTFRGYVKANKVIFQIIMIFTFSSNTKYVKKESITFIEN